MSRQTALSGFLLTALLLALIIIGQRPAPSNSNMQEQGSRPTSEGFLSVPEQRIPVEPDVPKQLEVAMPSPPPLINSSETHPTTPTATIEEAVVRTVIDGDTIELSSGERIRYVGIDTPEITNGKHECYGHRAAARNRELVEGKTIRIERDISETDRYGRLLRYVWVGNTFVNATLIAEGYATTLTISPDVTRAQEFLQLEQHARVTSRGLWQSCTNDSAAHELNSTIPQAETTSCPPERPIKGNAQSMIYHVPGGEFYERTKPEECFAEESSAQHAGYRRSKR